MSEVNANISTTQQSVQAYGVSVDSSGSFSFDGAVTKIMGILDSHAPDFVKKLMNAAAIAGAEAAAIESAFATAMAILPAELGAEVAVLGPFIPIAAAFGIIVPVLIALDPATGGPGCCGAAPATKSIQFMGATFKIPESVQRFGSCSPKEWDWYGPSGPGGHYGDQWAGDHWANFAPGHTVREWHSPNPWEEYVGHCIISAFNEGSDCWHYFQTYAYPIVLAAAIGAWNRTHEPNHTVTMPGGKQVSLPPYPIRRMVNVTEHVPANTGAGFNYGAHDSYGNADDPTDPISVALNAAAMKYSPKGDPMWSKGRPAFNVPPNTEVSFTIHMGPPIRKPLIPPLHLPKLKGIIPMGYIPNANNMPRIMPIVPQLPPLIHLLPIKMAVGGKPPIPGGLTAGLVAPKSKGMSTAEKVGIGAAVVGALGLGWHFLKG